MDKATDRLPIRYEMRTVDGLIIAAWMTMDRIGPQPTELWRHDYETGQRHRITGEWQEVKPWTS